MKEKSLGISVPPNSSLQAAACTQCAKESARYIPISILDAVVFAVFSEGFLPDKIVCSEKFVINCQHAPRDRVAGDLSCQRDDRIGSRSIGQL